MIVFKKYILLKTLETYKSVQTLAGVIGRGQPQRHKGHKGGVDKPQSQTVLFSFAKFLNILLLVACFVLVFSCDNASEKTYNEGAQLYKKHCENCHMEDGTGLEALYPPLANSDMLQTMGVGAACVIQNGLTGKIVVNGVEFETGMEGIKGLSAVEITNILNYIHNAWENKREFIQLDEVEAALKNCSPGSGRCARWRSTA